MIAWFDLSLFAAFLALAAVLACLLAATGVPAGAAASLGAFVSATVMLGHTLDRHAESRQGESDR